MLTFFPKDPNPEEPEFFHFSPIIKECFIFFFIFSSLPLSSYQLGWFPASQSGMHFPLESGGTDFKS